MSKADRKCDCKEEVGYAVCLCPSCLMCHDPTCSVVDWVYENSPDLLFGLKFSDPDWFSETKYNTDIVVDDLGYLEDSD